MTRILWAWRQLGREVIDINDWRLRDAVVDGVVGMGSLFAALALAAAALAGAPS